MIPQMVAGIFGLNNPRYLEKLSCFYKHFAALASILNYNNCTLQ
jgi:hypothetical protein